MTRQQNLPEPLHGGPPTRREGALPARRGTSAAPLHAARALSFVEKGDRDHWWGELDTAVRRRIAEKVGRAIEWWAYCDPEQRDRPYAVVFGVDGLAVTRPTVNDAGRASNLVLVRRFTPSSVRHAIVTQRPSHQPPATGQAGSGGALHGLTDDASGFLGHLPPEAQARLQGPFVAGDAIEDADFYYYGSQQGRLDVWGYLAGRRSVTFVSGRRNTPGSVPAHLASWDLICRIAEVAPR